MVTLRSLAIGLALASFALLGPASRGFAGTKLYYGWIRILLSTAVSSAYSIPFGSTIGYPHMNNLRGGDLVSTSVGGLDGVVLGANQMTLVTGLFTTAPPLSWGVSEARSTFVGGHEGGTFFAGGGPGDATSAPGSAFPASRLGVRFKGVRANSAEHSRCSAATGPAGVAC